MTLLEARSRQVERIPAEKFLALTPEQKAEIKRVRIAPPRLGDRGFGTLEVTYKRPRYAQ